MALPFFIMGGAVATRDSRWWTSNSFLYTLLAVGLVTGLSATMIEGLAKPSFLWFVEGELIVCRTWGPFEEPLRDTYKYERIEVFEVAADIYDPDKRVVRIRFDRLNLNIPVQNETVVDDLPGYVAKLNRWLTRVKDGESSARCWQIQPMLTFNLVLAVIAVAAWVILFSLIFVRTRKP